MKTKEQQKVSWAKNKDGINSRRRLKYETDEQAKVRKAEYAKEWQRKNKDKLVRNTKNYRENLRKKVLNYYSQGISRCACCGETEFKFLCLDHINNDGGDHRRELGGRSILAWVVQNNFPDGFQVLCFNCNMSKAFYGMCPHLHTIK